MRFIVCLALLLAACGREPMTAPRSLLPQRKTDACAIYDIGCVTIPPPAVNPPCDITVLDTWFYDAKLGWVHVVLVKNYDICPVP